MTISSTSSCSLGRPVSYLSPAVLAVAFFRHRTLESTISYAIACAIANTIAITGGGRLIATWSQPICLFRCDQPIDNSLNQSVSSDLGHNPADGGQIEAQAQPSLRDGLTGIQAGSQFRGGNTLSDCQTLVDQVVQYAVQGNVLLDRHTRTRAKFSLMAVATAAISRAAAQGFSRQRRAGCTECQYGNTENSINECCLSYEPTPFCVIL